jgi:glycerophosphoryl diester phosphodiesterase
MANLAIELGSLIQAHWPDQSTAPALVSSFSYPFLTAMRAQYPDCPIGYLVEGFNEQKIEIATAASFNTLHADKKSLVTYLDKHDIKSQLPIFCYTVNDAPTAKRLFDKGISAIFSDKAKLFG